MQNGLHGWRLFDFFLIEFVVVIMLEQIQLRLIQMLFELAINDVDYHL